VPTKGAAASVGVFHKPRKIGHLWQAAGRLLKPGVTARRS